MRLVLALLGLAVACKHSEVSTGTAIKEICNIFEEDGFLPYFLETLNSTKFSAKDCKRCQEVKLNFTANCKTNRIKGDMAPYPKIELVRFANIIKLQISNYHEYYKALVFFILETTKNFPPDSAMAHYCQFLLEAFQLPKSSS